jgi:hypothetical protein
MIKLASDRNIDQVKFYSCSVPSILLHMLEV